MQLASKAPFTRIVALGLLMGALASACHKPKEASTGKGQGPAGIDLPMSEQAKPEAEVSASSGPVKMTVSVYKTRIRKGQSLWLKITATNVGKVPIVVPDRYLELPYQSFGNSYGLGLTLYDPSGERLIGMGGAMEDHPLLDCMTKEERAPWDALHEQFSSGKSSIGGGSGAWLDPGESVSSAVWAFFPDSEQYCRRLPPPKAIAPYAEVPRFGFLEPGKYRIEGQYDTLVEGGFKDPQFVRFDLAPITVEIVP